MGKKKNKKQKVDPKRYKTFWRRFWAGTADGIILLAASSFISNVIWGRSETTPVFLLIVFHTLHAYTGLTYTILMHGFYGQTVGKMLCKVKVIDASEKSKITFWQALRRDAVPLVFVTAEFFRSIPNIVRHGTPYPIDALSYGWFAWIVMSFSMIWFFAEIITMLTNHRRRAVHDLIAGSVVVRLPRSKN